MAVQGVAVEQVRVQPAFMTPVLLEHRDGLAFCLLFGAELELELLSVVFSLMWLLAPDTRES